MKTRGSARIAGDPGHRLRAQPGRRALASFAVTVAITVAFAGVAVDPPAFADGRRGGGHGSRGGGFHGGFRGGRSAFVVASPFFSPFAWDWFYGFGWPYSPYGFRPEGGLDPAIARAQGLGGFDLNVKPRTAEVWVDGRYVGLARDFDGYPSFLWLEEGDHTIAISRGGYSTWEQEVTIDTGRVSEMKLELVPGPSDAPTSD